MYFLCRVEARFLNLDPTFFLFSRTCDLRQKITIFSLFLAFFVKTSNHFYELKVLMESPFSTLFKMIMKINIQGGTWKEARLQTAHP